MRLLEEKMENDRKAENEQQQQHNQTPPKCNCICQCGRYLSDSPIVDKVFIYPLVIYFDKYRNKLLNTNIKDSQSLEYIIRHTP